MSSLLVKVMGHMARKEGSKLLGLYIIALSCGSECQTLCFGYEGFVVHNTTCSNCIPFVPKDFLRGITDNTTDGGLNTRN